MNTDKPTEQEMNERFTCTIYTGTVAFRGAALSPADKDKRRGIELARMLRLLANSIESGERGYITLKDKMGEECGAFNLDALAVETASTRGGK